MMLFLRPKSLIISKLHVKLDAYNNNIYFLNDPTGMGKKNI